jgi:uncharacterized protein YjiS (DUF1127 family)
MSMKEIFRRWRRYRQMVRELESCSHGELTELGIAPTDIGRIAALAATRDEGSGEVAWNIERRPDFRSRSRRCYVKADGKVVQSARRMRIRKVPQRTTGTGRIVA